MLLTRCDGARYGDRVRWVGRVVVLAVEAGLGLALLAVLVGVAALVGIGLVARIVSVQSRRLVRQAHRRASLPVPVRPVPPAARVSAR